MDSDDGEDAALAVRERGRGLGRRDSGANRQHAVDAGGARAFEDRGGIVVARVEMRVCVDHAASAARCKRASSSATTRSGSSFLNRCSGFASFCPGGSALGCHDPTQLS